MDAYQMVLFPAIFIALLQFVFSTLAPDTSDVDTYVTILFNGTMWTSPDDPKYDTFFGNDPIGWFADNASVLFIKLGALFLTVGLILFPFASLMAVIPIAVTGILTLLFVFCYLMIIIGGYKMLSPFVGR